MSICMRKIMFHFMEIKKSPVISFTRRIINKYHNRQIHCVNGVRIRSFSGPYFPALGLNTERYRVCLHIQSECGKIRTKKTPNKDTFHAVMFSLATRETSKVSTGSLPKESQMYFVKNLRNQSVNIINIKWF